MAESYTWTAGTLEAGGPLVVPAGAALALTGPGNKVLVGRRVENAGAATWDGGR